MTDLTRMCNTLEGLLRDGCITFDRGTIMRLVDGVRERDEEIKRLERRMEWLEAALEVWEEKNPSHGECP